MSKSHNQKLFEGVRFSHLRDHKVVLTTDGTKRQTLPNGGATCAFKEVRDKEGGLMTLMAVKYCHPSDLYTKKQGRIKAAGLLRRLELNEGDLKETTHVGFDRYLTHAGSMSDSVAGMLANIEHQTGYRRG